MPTVNETAPQTEAEILSSNKAPLFGKKSLAFIGVSALMILLLLAVNKAVRL